MVTLVTVDSNLRLHNTKVHVCLPTVGLVKVFSNVYLMTNKYFIVTLRHNIDQILGTETNVYGLK